jgi:hypothetical protein
MNVDMGHVDPVGCHHIVEEPALGVKAAVAPFTKIHSDSDIQPRPRNKRSRIAWTARGGKTIFDPLSDLLLGIVRHILGFALGQSPLADQIICKSEIRAPQITHASIQN